MKAFSSLVALRNDADLPHLLTNAGKLLTSSTLVTVLQFVQVIILTHFLQQAGYGVFVALVAFVAAVDQFFDVRVSETTIRFGVEYRTKRDYTGLAAIVKLSYLIDFTTGLLAFLIVLLIGSWASTNILHDQSLLPLVQVYVCSLLISTVDNTSAAILRVTDKFTWSATYATGMAALELALATVVLLLGWGLMGLLLALLLKETISAIVNTVLAWLALRQEMPIQLLIQAPLGVLKERSRELRKYLFSTNFIAYVRMVTTKVDVLLLAYFRTPEEVALYKVAMQLASSVVRVSDPLFGAILPDLARLWALQEIHRFRLLLGRMTALMIAVLLPLAVGVVLLRDSIISLLFGNGFIAAAPIVAVAIWGFVVAGVFFWVWPAFLSIGRPNLGAIMAGGMAVVQVVLMYLLAPATGALGLATIYVLVQIANHAFAIGLLSRLLPASRRLEVHHE